MIVISDYNSNHNIDENKKIGLISEQSEADLLLIDEVKAL